MSDCEHKNGTYDSHDEDNRGVMRCSNCDEIIAVRVHFRDRIAAVQGKERDRVINEIAKSINDMGASE